MISNHTNGRARTALLAMTIALSTAVLSGCGNETSTMQTSDTPDLATFNVTIQPGDTVNLTVWGMSCPKCVTNVDQVLADIDGVTGVETDMANGIVTVTTGSPAPRAAQLQEAVTQAGFTPMRLEIAGRTR